jgi:peptidoglycan glycosyltransferase
VNRPITRLYGVVALLFLLLVGFTSRWTVFEASSLRANPENRRPLLEQERTPRGPILAANGAVLAHSVRGREGVYERVYPQGSLFAHPLGYYFAEITDSGLERYRNSELEGLTSSGLQSILNQLQGIRPQGDEVITTLDPAAQSVAMKALEGHRGAVVAIEPRTGAVTVMASSPSYDPNSLRRQGGFEALAKASRSPLINRATQYGYAPGSSFKVVTATAAIDSGLFTPESTLNGRNGIRISGVPLDNDYNQSFGQITLTKALALSVNTVWAQVAERLGRRTLQRYMERFGFDHKPQLDYPSQEMSASGEYANPTTLIPPTNEQVDLGRLGIGQDKLEVTALQMAEVASAVANAGTLMVPHLTRKILNSEGQTVQNIAPRVQSVVMKASTASAVTKMMEAVVNEGTGTPAKIPGVQVAGKTGTAETQFGNAPNNAWFIAFAPASAPRVAVAATLQDVPGFGATFAAPVARAVMESLLR